MKNYLEKSGNLKRQFDPTNWQPTTSTTPQQQQQ